MQPEGDTSDPPSDNPATSSDDADEQAAFELDQHAPSDQLASPDDDVESSRASSDWTSTVDGSADIGLNAPAGDLQQLPELSDSDAADDELETTDDDDSSSAGSADLAHELEHFVRRFERISIGGFDDHEQQQYLVMLTYELERDVKDPPAKPGPDACRPAADEVAEFDLRRADLLTGSGANKMRLRIQQMHPHKHHSTKGLHELERIELKSLLLRKPEFDHYLLVRTVTLPVLLSGLVLVCQDPSGTACKVELHGLPFNVCASAGELDALFPKGSLLAIKAPRLRDDARGDISVQCYSPTDVDVLSTDETGLVWHDSVLAPSDTPPKRTAKTWKKIGTDFAKKGWLYAAERAFTLGLQLAEHASMRLARSQVRSELGLKRGALDDANAVLALDQSSYSTELHQSALLRSVAAANELQLWALAQERLEQARLLCPAPNEHIDDLLEVVEASQRWASTGEIDWPALLEVSLIDTDISVPDSVRPALYVEAKEPGGGRCVVARADIEAGQLLVLAAPIAACYASECRADEAHLQTLNFNTMALDGATEAGLAHKLFARMADDPTIVKTLDCMYAGDQFACEPAGYPLANLAANRRSMGDLPAWVVDSARTEVVQTHCSVPVKPLRPEGCPPINDHAHALYGPLSLFCHNEKPNGCLFFIGDALVIRAQADIDAGTEVTVSRGSYCHDLHDVGTQWAALEPKVAVARDPLAWETVFSRRLQALEEYAKHSIDPAYPAWSPHPDLCLTWESLAYFAYKLACDCPDMNFRPEWAAQATKCGLLAFGSVGSAVSIEDELSAIKVTAPSVLPGVTIRICLLLAGAWKAVGDEASKNKWLYAASLLQAITFGGGRPMLARLFEFHLGMFGLDADELV